MKPLRYETYIKIKKLLKKAQSLATDPEFNLELVALFATELWIIPLIDACIYVLGWGLDKLLDALPHENEPRPRAFQYVKLHKPGQVFPVQDPRWVKKESVVVDPGKPKDMGKIIDAAKTIPETGTSPMIPLIPNYVDLIVTDIPEILKPQPFTGEYNLEAREIHKIVDEVPPPIAPTAPFMYTPGGLPGLVTSDFEQNRYNRMYKKKNKLAAIRDLDKIGFYPF